jgi:hypothetical protein
LAFFFKNKRFAFFEFFCPKVIAIMSNLNNTDESTTAHKNTKRTYVTTRGNHSKLPQQIKKISKKEVAKSTNPPELADMEASLELCKLKNCCPAGGEMGCIQKHFHGIYGSEFCFGESILFFKRMRNLISLKSEREKDHFIQEVFRESIVDEQVLPDGSIKFKMDFSLDNKRVKVCRKTFAASYGISIKQLERCSAALKLSDNRRVFTINNFRTYRDDTIHDYNYKETEELFKANLNREHVGI